MQQLVWSNMFKQYYSDYTWKPEGFSAPTELAPFLLVAHIYMQEMQINHYFIIQPITAEPLLNYFV